MSSSVAVATPASAAAPAKFPYDRSFVTKIVRTLYQDGDFALMMSAHLDPDLFDNKIHRWVVSQIFKHADKYGTQISQDAIENYAERAITYGYFTKTEVESVVDVIENLDKPVKDRTYVKDEVYGFLKAQKLKATLLAASEHYQRNQLQDADKLLNEYLNFSQTPQGLGHFFLRDLSKRLKRRKYAPENGIPTGTPLDDYMDAGGLPPRHLGVVVAPPGRGKSLTLVHLTREAILHNCQVLYVTLELSQEKITDRIDASFSNLYMQQLKKKSKEVRRIVSALRSRFTEALVVKEFPAGGVSVSGLRSYLRQLERVAFYPDMIVVDFADYLEPRVHYDDAYTELGQIYTDLRELAKSTNTAIWTASQGNRGSVNAKVVSLDAMADSFKKAGIADFVVGFSQTDKEKRMKKARLYIAKSRLGPTDVEKEVTISGGKQRIISTGGSVT